MISQSVPTTAQPTATAAGLRAQIKATEAAINDALVRRAGVEAEFNATTRPGARSRLGSELNGIDGLIGRLKTQLAGQKAELAQLEALPTTPVGEPVRPQPGTPAPIPVLPSPLPTAGTTVPPASPIEPGFVLGGLAIVFVLAPLAFALAVRLIRRGGAKHRQGEWDAPDSRLGRMEDSLAALTVELDRIAENQRFLTQALVGEGKQPVPREEFHVRR